MREKVLLDSRFIKLLMLTLLCIVGFLLGILIAEGKTSLLLLLIGCFLFIGTLVISSEALLALLIIAFQLKDLFPEFIKIGEINIVITDVIYMIILFKAFITLLLKKSVLTLFASNSKFFLSVILFGFVAFLSIIISPISDKLTLQAMSLARFSTYLLLPFLILLLISDKKQVLFLANVIIYTSIFQVFIAITHRILINFGYDLVDLLGVTSPSGELLSFSREGTFRLTGTTGDSGEMAYLLVLGLLLCVELSAFKFQYQGIRRKIMKAAPIILLCGLFLTQTRNAWVASAVALVSSLFIPESKLRHYFKPLIITITLFPVINFLITEMTIPVRTTSETFYQRIAGWRIAWSVFLDNPLLGTGWSGYRFESTKYLTAALPALGSYSRSAGFSQYSSSLGLYTQILGDLGLFGFGALIFLLYSAFRMIQRFTFTVKDLELRCLSRGILLSSVAFLSFSIFDVTFFGGSNATFLFFLLNGLAAVICVQYAEAVADKKYYSQYNIAQASKKM